MSILFHYTNDDHKQVEEQLRKALPSHTLCVWPEVDPASIEYAVVWNPPTDIFTGLTNLKCIFSIAAGVDHLLDHPALPEGVPIARLENAGMSDKMAEYVLYGVLHAHRSMQQYKTDQQREVWDDRSRDRNADEFKVGIMGMGAIGTVVAQRLVDNGYTVRGWSNSPKTIEAVDCYHGHSQLDEFLHSLQVLVCLLPLTPATRQILNKQVFDELAEGAFVINAARGGHMNNTDFLEALASGQLAGALLDVTDPEPLPAGHSFWKETNVMITPHIAAPTQVTQSITQIARNIERLESGEQLSGLVLPQRGY